MSSNAPLWMCSVHLLNKIPACLQLKNKILSQVFYIDIVSKFNGDQTVFTRSLGFILFWRTIWKLPHYRDFNRGIIWDVRVLNKTVQVLLVQGGRSAYVHTLGVLIFLSDAMPMHETGRSLLSLLGCKDVTISWTIYNNLIDQLKHVAATGLMEERVLELDWPGSCRGLSAAWWSGPTHSRWTRTTGPPPAAAACQSSVPASHTPAAAWSDPATQFHMTALLTQLSGGFAGTSFRHKCIKRTGYRTGNVVCWCHSLAGHYVVLWVTIRSNLALVSITARLHYPWTSAVMGFRK